MMYMLLRRLFPALFVFLLAACAGLAPEDAPLQLKPAAFSDLPGWSNDDLSGVREAFSRSCDRILKSDPQRPFGPDGIGGVYGDWQPVCENLPGAQDVRQFFEQNFVPYIASGGGSTRGIFTGYYEASLRGAATRHDSYQTPLYARPADLVMVDLGEFRPELKGQRIAGRVLDAYLKPYEDRAAISSGNWPHNDAAIIWVDDPVDAFFLHIQGSGRVLMEDGSQVRVGFDGQNGHVYYAIGRELFKRGALQKDDISMQSIRAWLKANPDQAAEIMNTNKSFVFFRRMDGEGGPEGGEGVPLTAERSLAVDRTKIPYGIPVWLDAEYPGKDSSDQRLQRLVMAQDTGGAIRGPVRGDFFWGFGPEAEDMAGKMKSIGQYWLLLPRH